MKIKTIGIEVCQERKELVVQVNTQEYITIDLTYSIFPNQFTHSIKHEKSNTK